jgi:hypothetical protein
MLYSPLDDKASEQYLYHVQEAIMKNDDKLEQFNFHFRYIRRIQTNHVRHPQ